MKKYIILVIPLLFAVVCQADTLTIQYGLGFAGYPLDSAKIVEVYGPTVDTLFSLGDGDSSITVIDTQLTITGSGTHYVSLWVVYDGFPGEWYEWRSWEVPLSSIIDDTTSSGYYINTRGKGTYWDTCVVATSGGTAIPNAKITISNLSGTIIIWEKTTDANGKIIVRVPASDSLVRTAWIAGYNITTDTVIYAADETDTMTATGYTISPPGSSSLCRVYAFCADLQGGWVKNAKLTGVLNSNYVQDTCSDNVIVDFSIDAKSNDTGYVYVDIPKTGCFNTTESYTFSLSYPSLSYFREWTISSEIDTVSTYRLR